MKRSEIIAYRIRKARKDAKLKQEEVAQRLGLGNSTVSEWENGKRSPSMEQIDELAVMFDTTAIYLLGLDETTSENAKQMLNPSTKALDFARSFDQLDETGKRLANGFMVILLEQHRKP